jgi:threonine synthase
MHYISTRNADQRFLLADAIARGLAPDGGLFVPEEFPHFTTRHFEALTELPEIAARLLAPFAEGDPLADELRAICDEAFNFPAMLRPLPDAPAPLSVLETSAPGFSRRAWSGYGGVTSAS